MTLGCEDGHQVAMNCIYIQSISVKCQIADISDQFVFNVKLHRYPINLSQQRRVGSSMCQLLNMQQLTNFWTDECEVRFKDLLYAKQGKVRHILQKNIRELQTHVSVMFDLKICLCTAYLTNITVDTSE